MWVYCSSLFVSVYVKTVHCPPVANTLTIIYNILSPGRLSSLLHRGYVDMDVWLYDLGTSKFFISLCTLHLGCKSKMFEQKRKQLPTDLQAFRGKGSLVYGPTFWTVFDIVVHSRSVNQATHRPDLVVEVTLSPVSLPVNGQTLFIHLTGQLAHIQSGELNDANVVPADVLVCYIVFPWTHGGVGRWGNTKG